MSAEAAPPPEAPPRTRLLSSLVFAGIALLMMSLSPAVFRMFGYMEEEVGSARQMLAKLNVIEHPSAGMPLTYTRNGAIPLLFHVPFLLASHWMLEGSGVAEDAVLSAQPVLLTAGLVAILFAWARRLTGSARWALLLSLCASFATLLWPYAYIGLETQQSFFLLLAGWLAIELRAKRGFIWTSLFVLSAAAAVTVKSNGAFLLPAVGFLVYEYSRSGRRGVRLAASVVGIVGAFAFAAYTRSFFWEGQGGTAEYIRYWLVSDGLTWALNAANFFGSANKGLFVFSPVLILAAASVPSLLRRREPVAIFTVLVLGGLAGGFSLLTCWADENWGPRYLHSAVAPLMLCLAASKSSVAFRWRRTLGIVALSGAGLVVSALGALFWYGSLHQIATLTGQNTLDAIHGDITWNHIKFNGRLLLVWLKPEDARDTAWTPEHRWYFSPPKGAPTWPTVDLRKMLDLNGRLLAVPQSFVFQRMAAGPTPREKPVIAALVLAGFCGSVLLLIAWQVARREDYGPFQSPERGMSVRSP